MKKVIVLISVLWCAFSATAQTRNQLQKVEAIGYSYKGLASRVVNYLPEDTLAGAEYGALSCKDSTIYFKKRTKWVQWEPVQINDSSFTFGDVTIVIRGTGGGAGSDNTKVPLTRTLTINGTTFDLTADRTWTITKSSVGLGNVDNTSDANKPVSTATQTALDLKQNWIIPGSNIYLAGDTVNALIDDFRWKPGTIVCGNSITMNYQPGPGENPATSWAGLIATKGSWSIVNQAISGSGVRKQGSILLTTNLPAYNDIPLALFVGFNNVRVLPADTSLNFKMVRASHRAMIGAHFAKNIIFPRGPTTVTFSNPNAQANGSSYILDSLADWGSRSVYFRANISGYSAAQWYNNPSVLTNETMTTTVTGRNVFVSTYACHAEMNMSRFKITVDGVDKFTYDPNGQVQTGAYAEGYRRDSIIHDGVFITGLTNISHTVVVTFLDGGRRGVVDWIGVLKEPGETVQMPVYVLDIPHMNATGYGAIPGTTTQAVMDSMTATRRRDLRATFKGYSIIFVDINSSYTASGSQITADGIHPTDAGQRAIANQVLKYMYPGAFVTVDTGAVLNYLPLTLSSNTTVSGPTHSLALSTHDITLQSEGTIIAGTAAQPVPLLRFYNLTANKYKDITYHEDVADQLKYEGSNINIADKMIIGAPGNQPIILMTNPDAPTDQKKGDLYLGQDGYHWRFLNDVNSAATNILDVFRSGYSVSKIQFPSTGSVLFGTSTDNGVGKVQVNGKLTVNTLATGNITDSVVTIVNNEFQKVPISNFNTVGSKMFLRNFLRVGDSIHNSLATDSAVFFGNSITAGFLSPLHLRWATRVSNGLNLFEWNLAIAGTTMVPRFTGDSCMYERRGKIPDARSTLKWLFFAYGTNDWRRSDIDSASFRSYYNDVIDYAVTTKGWTASQIVLVSPGHSVSPTTGLQHKLAEFRDIMLDLGRKKGVKVVDVLSATLANGGSNLLQADTLHPTEYGHQVWAVTVLDTLRARAGDIRATGYGEFGTLTTRIGANRTPTLIVFDTNKAVAAEFRAAFPSSGNSWMGFGRASMEVNTTGTNHVYFGDSVLANNTTGIGNVGIGHWAMIRNTTGQFNVAIGKEALKVNTTGNENTAVGRYAGLSLGAGNNNTLIGSQVASVGTAFSGVTAIGRRAYRDGTASNNTAIGYDAMRSNGAAVQNTGIGYEALLTNTGNNNAAIGYGAMRLNTTGANNVAIGNQAMDSSTTSSNNVGIGHQALRNNKDGVGNTAIGAGAGANLRHGSYNVFIGYAPLTDADTSVSNQIRIADGNNHLLLSGDALAATARVHGKLYINSAANSTFTTNGGDSTLVIANNEVKKKESLFEYVTSVTTTNTTAVFPLSFTPVGGTITRIEAECESVLSDGNGSYTSKKARTFLMNATNTLTNGTLTTYEPDEYLGTGLSTCTMTVTNVGSAVVVSFTGESGKTIKSKVKIRINYSAAF